MTQLHASCYGKSWFYRLRKRIKKTEAAVNGRREEEEPTTESVTASVSRTDTATGFTADELPEMKKSNADRKSPLPSTNPSVPLEQQEQPKTGLVTHHVKEAKLDGKRLVPSTNPSVAAEKKTSLTKAPEPPDDSWKVKNDATSSVKDLSPAEKDVLIWCRRWIFDIFQESYNSLDEKVRKSLNPPTSKEHFGEILISWQLTQMRVLKDYISKKENALGVTLTDKERSEVSYICTESFVQLVSEVGFQLKGDTSLIELSFPMLFRRYKCICRQVRSETLNNVKNV
jgi:hypothetical protein